MGVKDYSAAATIAGLLFLVAACGRTPAKATPDSLVARGAALYQTNCQSCHGGATGGSLRDYPPPHNANGHTWHHPDQQLTGIILNGLSFSAESQKMPAFKDRLSEEDVQAILAFIKTWWTEEQRRSQTTATADWEKNRQ